MAYFTGILITALVLYLVINPFFTQNKNWNPDDLKDDLDEISKEQIFATMNELEMEYNMGKFPEEDYKNLKKHYEALAIKKVKEEAKLNDLEINQQGMNLSNDAARLDQDIEREIEEELRKMKVKRGSER